MIVDKRYHGIEIYELVGDRLISKFYIGYSETEAVKEFKNEIKAIKAEGVMK